jgi:antitoxin (DNA-binding transcriptional repressor) of toxin-antitoxin stability system
LRICGSRVETGKSILDLGPRLSYVGRVTTTAEVSEIAGRIAELIDEVKAGNEVVLTEGSKPVARLVAPSEEAAILHTAGATRLLTANPGDFEIFGVFSIITPTSGPPGPADSGIAQG